MNENQWDKLGVWGGGRITEKANTAREKKTKNHTHAHDRKK